MGRQKRTADFKYSYRSGWIRGSRLKFSRLPLKIRGAGHGPGDGTDEFWHLQKHRV